MPRPLSTKMLDVLESLLETGQPMLLPDPGDYSAGRGLVRRGYAAEVFVRMDSGSNAKAFQITIKGWKVYNSLQKEGCHE